MTAPSSWITTAAISRGTPPLDGGVAMAANTAKRNGGSWSFREKEGEVAGEANSERTTENGGKKVRKRRVEVPEGNDWVFRMVGRNGSRVRRTLEIWKPGHRRVARRKW